MSNNQEKRRIGPYPNHRNGRVKFVQDLLQAGADGYNIPVENFNTEAKLQFGARLSIFLVKDAVEQKTDETLADSSAVKSPVEKPVDIEEAILASAKGLSKEDLLQFANDRGIEVPKDVKAPLAIRKHLKLALEVEHATTEEADKSDPESKE